MKAGLACSALVLVLGLQPAGAQDNLRSSQVTSPAATLLAPQPPATDAGTSPPAADPSASQNTAEVPFKGGEPWRWRILRTAWTERDEKGYEEFVAAHRRERLPQRARLPHQRRVQPALSRLQPGRHALLCRLRRPALHAARLLRLEERPAVLLFDRRHAAGLLQATSATTARGNPISSRRDLRRGRHRCAPRHPADGRGISSAHYRYPPDYTGKLLPDHYPVKIARDSIKPGTIIYDPNGHVAVVYKVTPEGRIHYIDTHPDNSLTRGVYGKAFTRSAPGMGAGFKRWRPQTLVGATQRRRRQLPAAASIGSPPTRTSPTGPTSSSSAPSPTGRRLWSAGSSCSRARRSNTTTIVRRRLASAGFKYDPLEETRSMVRVLCEDLKYRVDAVDVAIKAAHPQAAAARPASQQHLRHRRRLGDLLHALARCAAQDGLQGAARRGRPLPGRWRRQAASAWPTRGRTFARDSARRLPAGSQRLQHRLHAQRRQRRSSFPSPTSRGACSRSRSIRIIASSAAGARTSREELATCTDGADKRAWYEAEQRLRNQTDRTYDVRMGFSLADLRREAPGSGVDQPPDIDVLELLGETALHSEPGKSSE